MKSYMLMLRKGVVFGHENYYAQIMTCVNWVNGQSEIDYSNYFL